MGTVFFVRDAIGQDFLFTIADADHEPKFRKHAAWWMRQKHDPRKKSPVGKMTVHVMPQNEYKTA